MAHCLNADIIALRLEGNGLTVSLSPEFASEIEMRKQALAGWDQYRQGHMEEVLPEKPPRLHHYLFMCRALPMMVYKDPANFVRLVESPVAGKFLQVVWDTLAHAVGEEHAISYIDWNYAKYAPAPDMNIICLQFTPPVQGQEVWIAAVLITPGKKRLFLPAPAQYRFYTLESGRADLCPDEMLIWEWAKGRQQNCLLDSVTNESGFVGAIVANAAASRL